MPSRSRSRMLIVLVVATLAATGPASAQISNPVYVDDAPRAWELFRLAREQAGPNAGEAIRIYQELLDDYSDKLIPRHEAAADEFVSVRRRVLEDLMADETLLQRYRVMQTAEAQRLLVDGALARILRSRPLTEPGLEAMLRSAQRSLESARFWAVLTGLEDAIDHPDLTPERAAHRWLMTGVAAHYLGREDIVATAVAQLDALGRDGEAARASLARLAGAEDGPHIVRGISSIDRAESTDLTELVGQTIWSLEMSNSLIQRRFGEGSHDPSPPSAGYERQRRQGDLTTVAATVAGPTLYFNEGHTVRAVDRFTGRSVWEQTYHDLPRPSGIDRDKTPAGDMNVIAVEGDVLVTLTGHAYASSRSHGGRVTCIDARTGRRRWSRSLNRIDNEREYEGLFPHGAPVLVEGSVYVLARKVSPQSLTGVYVVALDAATGGLEWVQHIASSGSKTKNARAFSSIAFADGRLYIASAVGAIASLDADQGRIRWLRRYSVPVHIRSRGRKPWQMSAPLIVDSRVIAITPDQRYVAVLDRDTGDELASYEGWFRDRWNSPAYLLANDRMVFGIGDEIHAFAADALDRPLWRLPMPATTMLDDGGELPVEATRGRPDELLPPRTDTLTVAGRVQVVDGAIIVPTLSGILLVDDETGHVLHRLATNASGNPVAAGAQLIVAGADSLDAYMSLARAEQMLRGRIAAASDDPEPALALVQLGMRVGDIDLALEGADLALLVINRAPNQAEASGSRRELFTMLLEIHTRKIASTPDEREALYGVIGAVAATAEQRVEHLLAYGDGLAPYAMDRAVEKYQTVLSEIVLARTVRSQSGILRPASYWAAQRLARLIAIGGPRVYAPQDDYARRSLRHLLETRPDDDPALAALALEFPFSDAGIEAGVAAARVQRDRGDTRGALATLSSTYRLAPGADRAGPLLGAFVEICLEAELTVSARQILESLATMPPPTRPVALQTAAGPRDPREWLADLAPTTATPPPPRIRELTGSADELTAKLLGGALVASGVRGGEVRGWTDRALLLDDTRLRLVDATELEPIWTTTLESAGVKLLDAKDRGLLLWLGADGEDPRVTSLDPRTGRALWTTPRLADHIMEPLVQGRGVDRQMPDGMPFDPGEVLPLVGPEAIFLVRRTGGIASFDRAQGAPRWSRDHTLQQVHLALAHPFGIVLTGLGRTIEATGKLEPTILVLDPRTGTTLHHLTPAGRSGVLWLTADPSGALLCATADGIEMIDLLTGRRPWTNVALDVTDARQGWIANDTLITESRAGAVFTLALADGTLSPPFDTAIRGNWERDALKTIHVVGDRIYAQYRDRIIRYDADGNVRGADIVSENRDYRWLLPAKDRLVVVSQHDTRQVQINDDGDRRTQRTYRIYVLSPNCKLEGQMIELPPVTRRLRQATLIDGWLLLSTSVQTFAVPLAE